MYGLGQLDQKPVSQQSDDEIAKTLSNGFEEYLQCLLSIDCYLDSKTFEDQMIAKVGLKLYDGYEKLGEQYWGVSKAQKTSQVGGMSQGFVDPIEQTTDVPRDSQVDLISRKGRGVAMAA